MGFCAVVALKKNAAATTRTIVVVAVVVVVTGNLVVVVVDVVVVVWRVCPAEMKMLLPLLPSGNVMIVLGKPLLRLLLRLFGRSTTTTTCRNP